MCVRVCARYVWCVCVRVMCGVCVRVMCGVFKCFFVMMCVCACDVCVCFFLGLCVCIVLGFIWMSACRGVLHTEKGISI